MSNTEQRQLQYNWDNRFHSPWVGRYEDLLSTLEQYIPDQEAYWTIVDRTCLFRDIHVPGSIPQRDAVAAISYLVIKDRFPWFSYTKILEDSEIDQSAFSNAVLKVTDVYEPELNTPEDYLDRMGPRLSKDQMEQTRIVLAAMPTSIKEKHYEETVLGAAMHFAFGHDLDDDSLTDRLGDVIPRRVRLVVEALEKTGFEPPEALT